MMGRLTLPMLALLICGNARSALPHLDLDVSLDPATRMFDATAVLTAAPDLAAFNLALGLRITRMEVDGRPVSLPASEAVGNMNRYRIEVPAHSLQDLRLSYQGRLSGLIEADQRQVLLGLPPMADPEGSYLPAGSGWYPDPGQLFSYTLRIHLPPGQKGVAPGRLLRETDDGQGYMAKYTFPQPSEGIELMAGPYQVSQRSVTIADGKTIRLRTWFHPDLADLAADYLDDTARYIQRYSQLIGPYPYDSFGIVSSPLPTGFGMPGLTYLGRQVLRLPFIRATSLGHEILHNWWGNGVYPDWASGNWSEGLTTFLADYAYKEDDSPQAARQARLEWLRNLAAVPAGEDTALKDFVARRHGISSIVGYDKSAMVFFMLRDLIGPAAFEQGLRLFWQQKRFQTASWADLEVAFAQASRQDLSGFFRQWVQRPGAPRISIAAAEQQGDRISVKLEQKGDYALRVPLRLRGEAGSSEDRWIDLSGHGTTARFEVQGRVRSVELDPDYRLWRHLDPALFPAILREVLVAPQAGVVMTDADEGLRKAAWSLAGHLLDAQPVEMQGQAAGLPGRGPVLILGTGATVDAWLARQGLAPRPHDPGRTGSAQVWAERDRSGRPYAVVSARDAAALQALERALPHYGKQSWLAFDGPRVTARGIWPAGVEQTCVMPQGTGSAGATCAAAP